jgi:hypothetical protein
MCARVRVQTMSIMAPSRPSTMRELGALLCVCVCSDDAHSHITVACVDNGHVIITHQHVISTDISEHVSSGIARCVADKRVAGCEQTQQRRDACGGARACVRACALACDMRARCQSARDMARFNNHLLRRHFFELSECFLAVLESFFATLLPG